MEKLHTKYLTRRLQKSSKLVALKKGKVKLTVTLKATKNYNQKKVTITIKVK